MRAIIVAVILWLMPMASAFAIDAQPAPVPSPACQYPPLAVRLNWQGRVVVGGTITTTGKMKDPYVAKSSGYGVLDKAALDCMGSRQFQPAMLNGTPVESSKKFATTWALQGGVFPPVEASDSIHICKFDMAPDMLASVQSFTEAKFTVTEDGRVQDISVPHTSGNDAFDKAVTGCILGWKYEAKRVDGKPTKADWAALVRVDLADGVELAEQPNSLRRCSLLSGQIASLGTPPSVTAVVEHDPFQAKTPKDIALLRSTGNAKLDAASLACVKIWGSRPAYGAPFPAFLFGTAVKAFGVVWNGDDGQLAQ